MIKNQENKLSSYHLTEEKLNINNGIWAGIPAFAATKTKFSNRIVSIHSASSIQQAIITGIATDKKVLKLAMIDMTAPVAANLKALASQTNNNELFEAVNYSRSELIDTRDENIADICQAIHAHATTHIAALADFGTTALILTAVQTAINAYIAKVPGPGSAKISRKTATTNLRNLFKDTDKILKNELDQMMLQFKTTEPDFFKDYTAAREIIDLGATHTTFRIFLKDQSANPLAGAIVGLLQNNVIIYSVISGADGKAVLSKIKPGTYDMQVIKANYVTKTETGIVFKAGKAVRRTVTLTPGAPAGLITITREGDVAPNSVVNISLNGINTTGLTLVSVEVTLGPLDFYAAPTGDALPGSIHLPRPVGTTAYAIADFSNAVGFSSENGMLNVHNAGASNAHYKLTFSNLEP